MESDSDDSDSFTSPQLRSTNLTKQRVVLAAKRDTSAYLQHITDVCDPPAHPDLPGGKATNASLPAFQGL